MKITKGMSWANYFLNIFLILDFYWFILIRINKRGMEFSTSSLPFVENVSHIKLQ